MQERLWSDGHKLLKSLQWFIKMKKLFSKNWKASKQPRKQRKYLANAPLHLKRKQLSANLSKELRKKYGMRNIELRKGDKVKILRGKFRGKEGKITEIKTKMLKVYVEGIRVKKQDGSKANIALRASNLQIIELGLEDKKRIKKLKQEENIQKPNKQTKEKKK